MTDLLREGRITLALGEWIGDDHPRKAVEDVDTALRDWATWVPQPDNIVRLDADAGSPLIGVRVRVATSWFRTHLLGFDASDQRTDRDMSGHDYVRLGL